jgi:CMP-N,N'-diacetyllegionaminic acid synthase
MYDKYRILAVVPARGGSKGVPLKNLRPVGGVPLVARVSHLVRELGWIDRAVVSTDHPEIAAVAREAGLDAPFMRPPELSGDRIGDIPVLQHALQATEEVDGCTYDIILMLQPTSPLRRPEHVTATVEKLVCGGYDAAWTVNPTDLKYHPLKQLAINADGSVSLWDPAGENIIARQQLGAIYHRNGAAYALSRDCLIRQGTLLGERSAAVVLDEPMLSIDTEEDFARVEAALAARNGPGHAAGNSTKTFVVDIDGVLATLVPDNDYGKCGPIPDNICRVNELHAAGHRIILFTARGSATGIDWSEVTRTQLETWGVRYHELRFGKPAADFYIDDRLTTLTEAVRYTNTDNDKGKE